MAELRVDAQLSDDIALRLGSCRPDALGPACQATTVTVIFMPAA